MTTKYLRLALLVSLLSISFVLSSNAQNDQNERRKHKPPTFAQLLEDMDKNEDGKLSKSEIKGPLKDDFDKVDLNEDGFITEEEFKKAPKPERRNRRDRDN